MAYEVNGVKIVIDEVSINYLPRRPNRLRG